MTQVAIHAQADHTSLVEKVSYDVAAVRITARDEYGNVLPSLTPCEEFGAEDSAREYVGPPQRLPRQNSEGRLL